eukprot:m.74978 g.74978  ORF g.74978 m.74978 type:complete len:197 (-) comp24723_c2_seq1:58-648(-)
MAGTIEISEDKPVDWVVYGLFILLGLGSWTTINGLFVELPVFYQQLPEQGKIYADVSLTIQLANVVPLGITVARRYCGLGIVAPTYVVLSAGVAVMIMLGSVWQETAFCRKIPETVHNGAICRRRADWCGCEHLLLDSNCEWARKAFVLCRCIFLFTGRSCIRVLCCLSLAQSKFSRQGTTATHVAQASFLIACPR